VEGAVIGLGLILLGLLSVYLAVSQWRDYRANQNDFAPRDAAGLHPLWKTTFRIQRFSSHLDIWIFAVLGPALVIGGVIALLK
jgi:hypothetical protein